MLSETIPSSVPAAKPASKGTRWKDAEDVRLLDEIKENISLAKIAAEHSRTIGGI